MSMGFPLGERYLAGESLLHRLDARTKVVGTLAFIFAATLTPTGHWPAFAMLALLVALAVALSRLSPLLVMRRSALALPFLIVAVPLLFTKQGEALFTIPVFALQATDSGLTALGTVLARSWLSVCAAVVLTATTAPLDLLRALRGLGMPRIIVATVMFMYRYLFVIGEEAMRLMRARESRSARVDRQSGGSLPWRAKVLGNMVGSLFLRSYERSERIFHAMTARGFSGELRFSSAAAMARIDWLMLAFLGALLVGVQVYARF
jgi:cobalt/nickel transport system permease protein